MRLRFGKTEVEISYLFVCLVALCIILGMFGNFLLCLFAILIHEFGHIAVMLKFGHIPQKIRISLFEIFISDDYRHSAPTRQNILIIFFGPFANFICFICFFLLYLFCNKAFLPFSMANLAVCLFNLLPVLSLDGGQLLYLILSLKFNHKTCEKAVNTVTFIFIFPLAALGFLVLFDSKNNFSLLLVSVYLIFSLFFKNDRYF